MFVVSQEGAQQFQAGMVGIAAMGAAQVRLMGSPGTPLHTWTLATYLALELPATGGYAAQTIPASFAGWTASVLTAGGRLTSEILTWTFTTALTVYGWFIQFAGTGVCWGGEEFSPAFTFAAGGGVFTWMLPLDLISCPGVASC